MTTKLDWHFKDKLRLCQVIHVLRMSPGTDRVKVSDSGVAQEKKNMVRPECHLGLYMVLEIRR